MAELKTLYEHKNEYLQALENLIVDEDGTILNIDELDKIEDEFKSKSESVGLYIKELKTLRGGIKGEIDNLKGRLDGIDKKIDSLTDYLAYNMQAVGVDKIETEKLSLGFRESTAVEITDESVIPREYIDEKISYTVSKKRIGDAIKSGILIDGATLVKRRNLQVK